MAGSMLWELEAGWLVLSNFSVDAVNTAKKPFELCSRWSSLLRQVRISGRGVFGVRCRSSSARVQALLQCSWRQVFCNMPCHFWNAFAVLSWCCEISSTWLLKSYAIRLCTLYKRKHCWARRGNKFRNKNERLTPKHSKLCIWFRVLDWTKCDLWTADLVGLWLPAGACKLSMFWERRIVRGVINYDCRKLRQSRKCHLQISEDRLA